MPGSFRVPGLIVEAMSETPECGDLPHRLDQALWSDERNPRMWGSPSSPRQWTWVVERLMPLGDVDTSVVAVLADGNLHGYAILAEVLS